MLKKSISFLFLLLVSSLLMTTNAQIRLTGYHQKDINPTLFSGRWRALWISVPGEPLNVYGVYHFRKSFDLSAVPEHFIIHVTADNRYKLFVNGQKVSEGPARCDVYNWNFETVDIAPYLKSGKNVLASVVWNYAEKKPVAQMSFNETGFLLQGNTDAEKVVNTNGSWLCIRDNAYSVWSSGKVLGYYAVGPCERIDAAQYPWGWEKPDFDDSSWLKASAGMQGAMKGSQDYPGRLLVPSPLPQMESSVERLSEVRLSEGLKCPKEFPAQKTAITIPANTSVKLILDNKRLTTGYFTLLFSKGKAAEVEISYAEALYTKDAKGNPFGKGNRNEIEGKVFCGYADKLIADGGEGRNFTSLWWRTWRYVDLEIKTANEPLVIDDIYGTFTAYPYVNVASFNAPGHDELSKMLEVGWRTARLCLHETYMDCPYYEQLQYFGDARIQQMITMYNSKDTIMVKNCLEHGRQSMIADGITQSRYPTSTHQFISSYALSWIESGYDYWMYRGDVNYLKTLLPQFRQVISWYESYLKPDYSLAYIPNWFFADWSKGFSGGQPVRESDGRSAYQDLIFLYTLDQAAEMEKAFGFAPLADHYRELSEKIRQNIRPRYWDEQKGLFADTYSHKTFSQHVNSLAVLTGIVKGDEAKSVMLKTLSDSTLIQATIYFTYYVNQALKTAGLGNKLLDNMQIWRDQLALGLTTFAEQPEPSRSDCHAWSASPNIELYRILLGIDTDAPGFAKVRIAPSLCGLKEASGKIPHPAGFISVSYKIDKKGKLNAMIDLPESLTGTFVWNGKEYPLKGGSQTLSVE